MGPDLHGYRTLRDRRWRAGLTTRVPEFREPLSSVHIREIRGFNRLF
jgi:hypothetical protein